MTTRIINNTIYLICRGTSTNDIIDSINSIKSINSTKLDKGKSKSFFDIFSFKKKNNNNIIKKEEFSSLDNIGINELRLLLSNANNENLLNFVLSTQKIYTSLEYSSIESALILTNNIPNIKIYPLSYMSNKTNIKSKELLFLLKTKFGSNYIKSHDITISKNYWDNKIKKIDSNFIDIKSKSSIIDWTKLDNTISSYNSYNLDKIKRFIKKLCEDSITNFIVDNIIIADGKLIEDILKLCKTIRYNKKRYTIERSSIWEINISSEVYLDITGKVVKSDIKFDNFIKLYPTEYNYEPLKYNRDVYSYEYKYNKYILFNSLSTIPLKYIKNMEFNRLSDDNKSYIKKILEKKNSNIPKNNKDKDDNKDNNKDNNKNSKKFKFETS